MIWRLTLVLLAILALNSCSGPAERQLEDIPEKVATKPVDVIDGESPGTLATTNAADNELVLDSVQVADVAPSASWTPTPILLTPGSSTTPSPQTNPDAAPATPVPPAGGLQEQGSVPPPEPSITYFRANVSEANPGDTITLDWAAEDVTQVTLWRLMPTGQLGQWWQVPTGGQVEYTIQEGERNATRFALYAGDGVNENAVATLSIKLLCPDSWFFSGAPDICPQDPPVISAAAYQRFERGLMIWIQEEDQVYILFDDGSPPGWTRQLDRWEPGMPVSNPQLLAPPGLHQPVRGFGLVWREEPGVRDRLGWGMGDEIEYEAAVQRTSYAKYNETYISAADGGVWRLLPERSGWEKLAGG